MFQRINVGLAVGCVAVFLVGCGTRTGSPSTEPGSATPADAGRVTLHVKDMAKLLKLG